MLLMLALRRILAAICYIAMLAADAALLYVIYVSINGGITYYLGMLIFIPVFIFTWWMSAFFSQLTYGRENEKKIMPKTLRFVMNLLSSVISIALIAFWGYIYVMQQLNAASNESLITQAGLPVSADIWI